MDLKTKLEQLINSSSTLKSLSPDELKARKEAMLSGDPESIAEFITILEEEAVQFNKIDEEYAKKATAIDELVVEAQHIEKKAEVAVRHEEEKEEHAEEETKAEDIINGIKE